MDRRGFGDEDYTVVIGEDGSAVLVEEDGDVVDFNKSAYDEYEFDFDGDGIGDGFVEGAVAEDFGGLNAGEEIMDAQLGTAYLGAAVGPGFFIADVAKKGADLIVDHLPDEDDED